MTKKRLLITSCCLSRMKLLFKGRFGIPMSLFVAILLSGLVTIFLTGCTTLKKIVLPSSKAKAPSGITLLPAYVGPKARITIVDFETTKAGAEIGLGLRQMLINALIESNRFLVVEVKELPLADLIISLAVTEFEPQASGGRAGVGGGGGVGRGLLGGLLGSNVNKAQILLGIRIVDASTSKVLAVTDVKGQAVDIEKAMRICIIEAARYISKATPAKFYKY